MVGHMERTVTTVDPRASTGIVVSGLWGLRVVVLHSYRSHSLSGVFKIWRKSVVRFEKAGETKTSGGNGDSGKRQRQGSAKRTRN